MSVPPKGYRFRYTWNYSFSKLGLLKSKNPTTAWNVVGFSIGMTHAAGKVPYGGFIYDKDTMYP